ncbi:hypothetical protein PLICRDRAFT_110381 [Plicaturopsis crispa FD-325 SS-3]|nr:hypothetical protein PLICRDRAFT_110381 [Plicaturopsis crispa FD-325 SS-3]
MSLLQGVLRSSTNSESLDKAAHAADGRASPSADRDEAMSDDELINVASLPGTPIRSPLPSRPSSPTRRAAARPLPGPLHLPQSRKAPTDPLKAFPTELSQRIFARLTISELAKCARVSRKWAKSQTLNYIWFQHYRKENFHDESLPPGKWSKRESKQNWRTTYLNSISRSPRLDASTPYSRGSGYSTPAHSGYQTPRELKEEQWKLETEVASRPGKVEMREMYKELGGRKSKAKTKLGGAGGIRDKGGWTEGEW